MIRTQDYIREVVTIFFAQKRIIIGVALAITAAAVLIAFFWPPTYVVEAAILVKSKKLEKSPEALEQTELRISELSREDLASEMRMIVSHDVVRKAVERLAADGLPLFEDDSDKAVEKAVSMLQEEAVPEILPNSNIIRITFQDRNAKRGLVILRRLVDTYIRYRAGIYNPSEAEGFYERQRDKFQGHLLSKEDELIDLVRRTGAPDPAGEMSNNLEIKRTLEAQLEGVRNQYIEQKLYVEHLDETLSREELQFFSFIVNDSIGKLSEKLQDLVLERGNLLRVFHPQSSKVMRINEQVDNIYAALKHEVEVYTEDQHNQLDILADTIESLELRLKDLALRNVQLHENSIQTERIQREADLLKHSFETFSNRWEEARITSSSDANNLFSISVLSRPYTTGVAVFPRKAVVIPLGMIVGLLTGCALGYTREYFDHTFKKPEDTERYAGLRTLFSMSHME